MHDDFNGLLSPVPPHRIMRLCNGKRQRTLFVHGILQSRWGAFNPAWGRSPSGGGDSPLPSWQKPSVGNNHRPSQEAFPKGESMDFPHHQEKMNLAMSRIDSVIRASLRNVTAARRFAQCYGEDVLEKLGIGEIAPGQVS